MNHGGCADHIRKHWDELLGWMGDYEAWYHIASSEELPPANNSIDLIVTSPPYPMVEMWEERFGEYDDIHEMIENVMKECYRVLRKGGIMCVNMGDAVRSYGNFQCFPNHAELLVRGRDMGFESMVPIHWMKPTNKPNSFLGSGFLPPNAYTTLDTEYILVFRKEGPREFEDGIDTVLRHASQYTKDERDVWFSQQWKVVGETQEGMAVFPREIPYRLIRMFSCLGDTVLDPFCGTGTTLEVARALGRNAVGFEVNSDLEPYIQEKIGRVNGITNDDILENFVKNEELPKFGVDEFVSNPNSLLDFKP